MRKEVSFYIRFEEVAGNLYPFVETPEFPQLGELLTQLLDGVVFIDDPEVEYDIEAMTLEVIASLQERLQQKGVEPCGK